MLSNTQFSSIFDSLVRYDLRLWNCSQLNKDNSKENTRLSQWPFHMKHKPNLNYPNKSRSTASWLAKTTMARIVLSLQLAKTEDCILTTYTALTPCTYTFGRLIGEFFCIQHSSRGTTLCRLASVFFARLARWQLWNHKTCLSGWQQFPVFLSTSGLVLS